MTNKPKPKKTPVRGFNNSAIQGYVIKSDEGQVLVNTDLMMCDLIGCYKASGASEWQVIDRLSKMWPTIQIHKRM